MNRTGSIPFFTSENSCRSWGAFFGDAERVARSLGEGGGQGSAVAECWVRSRFGAVGVKVCDGSNHSLETSVGIKRVIQ